MIELNIKTSKKCQMVDISRHLASAILTNKWENGVLTIFIPHTTAVVTINENADPDVLSDMTLFLERLVPNEPYFKHYEGNSDAHIKASLFGSSESIIVENSRLVLGRWQGIYFCEFDGGCERKIWLKFVG